MTDASRVAERLAAWEASLKDFRLPDWESLPQLGLYMDQVILLLRQYLGPLSRSEEDKPITASIINNAGKKEIQPGPFGLIDHYMHFKAELEHLRYPADVPTGPQRGGYPQAVR